MNWKGVFPAVTTKFHADGSLDMNLFFKNLDFQLACGVHGIILGGTLGESSVLSQEEKITLTRETVNHIKGRVPVILNIAEGATKDALFWAKKAEMWQLDNVEEAKKSLCGNCAAFDITTKTLDCIAKGIGDDEGTEDPFDVIEAGKLGYCRMLKFKCASARTCDAWVVGGPIK